MSDFLGVSITVVMNMAIVYTAVCSRPIMDATIMLSNFNINKEEILVNIVVSINKDILIVFSLCGFFYVFC